MAIDDNYIAGQLKRPFEFYQNWSYKNTTLLVVSLLIFWYFAGSDTVKSVIQLVGELGYVGALLTGMFLVSTFTVAPALVVLYHLAEVLNPFEIAVLAGIGGVGGDYLIFRYLKDRIFTELKPLLQHLGGSYISTIFKTPYFAWLTPLIGAAIIASPFPDEIGVGILGISKLKNWQFILLSFLLNATGIFIVVTIARSF
ncbi:MAG: hypothetical protein WAP74_04505 [Patescibacteria group bacterium]